MLTSAPVEPGLTRRLNRVDPKPSLTGSSSGSGFKTLLPDTGFIDRGIVSSDRIAPNPSVRTRSAPDPTSKKHSEANMTGEEPSSNVPGALIIANNETIRSFLLSASQNPQIGQSLRESASHFSRQTSIPYKTLREIWSSSPSSTRPSLRRLFYRSDFVFSSPKPREKSEELKARLRKLAELAEKKAYDELVSDIKPRKGNDEPFSSYKDQIGFGLHVGLTMFAGFLVGYAAFRALFDHNPAMNAAGGIFGLVFVMLLETVLFIIRTSSRSIPSPSFTSKQKKHQ